MRDRLDVSALRACVIAVVLATSFAFLFVAPSHDPSPNDLPVAVVGPTAATAPFVGALEQREGQFHVVRLVDAKAGRDAVLDRDVYGTFIVTRPKAPELLVATAASPAVAGILKDIAAGASRSEPLRTTDLQSLDPDDPRGTTINATSLAVTSIVAVLSAVLISMMAPGLGGIATLGALAVMAVLGGLFSMAVVNVGIGALPGSYLALAGVIALGMISVSSVAAAIIARVGRLGIGLSFIIFLAIASPATGAASDPHLLPDPWAWAGQLLPPGAAATGLRDVAYFDGARASAWLPVLLIWIGIGGGLLVSGDRRRRVAHAAPAGPPAKLRLTEFARERLGMATGIAVASVAVAILALVLTAGDDGNAASRDERAAVKVIDPRSRSDAEGAITLCTGKDVNTSRDGRMHQHEAAIKAFNAKFGPDLHANLVQFSDEAPQQYEQFSRLQRARSGDCDVFYSDVTWTADFAHNGWLLDLSPYVRPRLNSFVPAMRDAATFDGKIWGVPKQADAGLLFYDKASVKDPPRTWQQLYEAAAEAPGNRFRYQALDYEGLTVNFLELAFAAGAEDIVTPKRTANITQYPALVALQLMVDGIKNGAAPYDVVNQKEASSLYAFGHGRADFMRNWPFAYAALDNPRKYAVAGNVGVAPLPSWEGRAPVSLLGGHILVISAFSKNPAAALQLVDYLSSREVVKRDAIDFSLAPALVDLWKDPDVLEALPASADLKSAVFNAKVRPVTPNYDDVSEAISKNVNRALRGSLDPQAALETANDEMQEALDEAYNPALSEGMKAR